MTKFSTEEDRALLESLGVTDDLVDSPAGARLIRVMFGDPIDEADFEYLASADQGFACCD